MSPNSDIPSSVLGAGAGAAPDQRGGGAAAAAGAGHEPGGGGAGRCPCRFSKESTLGEFKLQPASVVFFFLNFINTSLALLQVESCVRGVFFLNLFYYYYFYSLNLFLK